MIYASYFLTKYYLDERWQHNTDNLLGVAFMS
jgi:hypothetical protein